MISAASSVPVPVAYGYSRASTIEQEDTLDVQRDQTQAYYVLLSKRPELTGLIWGDCFRDPGVSGRSKLLQREGGRQLNARLRAGDHVIISKVDRAFRSTEDCLQTVQLWLDRGVHVHFLDMGMDLSTAIGKMMLTILAAVAEW